MYRDVIFHTDGTLVHKGHSRRIMQGVHVLKIDHDYIFNEVPFYVMQGSGQIDVTDLPHSKPSFDKIMLKNLDYYIQNKTHRSRDYTEQQQIEAFYRIFTYNAMHNEPKLFTQSYNELEQALIYPAYHVVRRF